MVVKNVRYEEYDEDRELFLVELKEVVKKHFPDISYIGGISLHFDSKYREEEVIEYLGINDFPV